MSDIDLDLLTYGSQGFNCSQILILLGLRLQDRENPELVRAMDGLGNGLGFSGETCGALLGGCCLIAMNAGKGAPEERAHDRLPVMIAELVEWFRSTPCAGCPGIRCSDILDDNESGPDMHRCGSLVSGVYTKAVTILQENDIDPTVPFEDR
ncbi:DVU_1555 family C-GCAxxG-C-C protein [Oceanidesulfovibrio marinus]|uniref:C_GCAxxG_C_C family protein n=1 Tax=Oceanidesulfovibrio marinus TaxID=370038 RepID=A0A6P1ZJP5_9BACT|nr:DV_1555 family C-GCAxxG-C-C protein [Oceanidesulfovibrio marinus]QJT09595.1 C_GCAxxG_C_C family protein [Oceanidesulfovibrio marinus]TVM33806.1 hypothetical protein DQK91_11370 [Oceanidesulfovibrio marinus]